MPMGFSSKGDTNKTEKFLAKLISKSIFDDLDRYGAMGVSALAQATPKDSGETALHWKYRITRTPRSITIDWYNDHEAINGTPIAVLIQFGHGTGTGGYVQGRDFVNPAIRPIFDRISDDIWEKVRTS